MKDYKISVLGDGGWGTTLANLLSQKGYKIAVVAGGGTLNASFLKEGLVDELFLDVEPVIIGKGLPLFAGKQFGKKLELLGIKKLSKNEIQLHYKVLKK